MSVLRNSLQTERFVTVSGRVTVVKTRAQSQTDLVCGRRIIVSYRFCAVGMCSGDTPTPTSPRRQTLSSSSLGAA